MLQQQKANPQLLATWSAQPFTFLIPSRPCSREPGEVVARIPCVRQEVEPKLKEGVTCF